MKIGTCTAKPGAITFGYLEVIAHDGGATWNLTLAGVSGAPYPCGDCGFAFLGAQLTLAVGDDDSVNLLWNATRDQTNYTPGRIYFARSTDGGHTYSARQDVSLAAPGVEHCFMAIDSTGATLIGWGESGSYAGPGNIWTSHD